ncbi:MAG: hypothetical protein AVDCRST_MAG68-153, partial [uncultured Gemmatimonadetes bacterium]
EARGGHGLGIDRQDHAGRPPGSPLRRPVHPRVRAGVRRAHPPPPRPRRRGAHRPRPARAGRRRRIPRGAPAGAGHGPAQHLRVRGALLRRLPARRPPRPPPARPVPPPGHRRALGPRPAPRPRPPPRAHARPLPRRRPRERRAIRGDHGRLGCTIPASGRVHRESPV